MRQAQTIDVLGEYTWMMTPVLFIITAVLGFQLPGRRAARRRRSVRDV